MANQIEKQENFEKLAVKRMNKLIKDARLLANLGNTANYIGTPEQKEKMIECIKAEVDNIDKALTSGTVQSNGFTF